MYNQSLGHFGEKIAKHYLENKHYLFLEKNYRYQKGEVDLICQDLSTNEMVFVEVKTRKNTYVNPLLSVNLKKQHILMKVANNFCVENNISLDVRFDVLVIKVKNKLSLTVNHIDNAFSTHALAYY